MGSNADIWLGDAARAFIALRPKDDAARAAIARLLGMAASPRLESVRERPTDNQQSSRSTREQAISSEISGARSDTWSSRALDDLPLLTPIRTEPTGLTGWNADELPQFKAEHLGRVPRHEPLLAPRSVSAVLHALLAQDVADGPVDVAAIVETVARRQPLPEIPRELHRTLRFGVQLLLDVGEGMEPFLRDEEMLAEQVHRIVGTTTQVAYFADCPLRGTGSDSVSSWDDYRSPHSRTPVLVISDFGIGGPSLRPQRSRPEEWMRFAQLLTDAGCPVAGLLPYPSSRWPVKLARRIPLLTWDRGITVGAAFARMRVG
jgi:hypothetical protein